MSSSVDYADINEDDNSVLSVSTEAKPGEGTKPAVGINTGYPDESGSMVWSGVNLGPDSVAALIAQLQSWQRREVFGCE